MIPLVLTVYKRPHFLIKQLEMIKNQTCVNDIELHIISNNPDINFNEYLNGYEKDINIKFVQRYNKLQPFERHYYCKEQNFDHVILFDDDIFFDNTTIENIWKQKEANTLKGHWLRQFKSIDINKKPYTESPIDNDVNKLYHYIGTNLCIFDNSIYDLVIPEFEKYKEQILEKTNIRIERMDDLFISWVANINDYRIKSFGIKPTEFYGDDEFALYKVDFAMKDLAVNYLNSIHAWKYCI